MERISDLSQIGADRAGKETLWVVFHKFEQVRWSRCCTGRRVWSSVWKDKIVIIEVLEEVKEFTYVRVAFVYPTLNPCVVVRIRR
jgi:hypothetical protein